MKLDPPLKAIRKCCLRCCCNSAHEVSLCVIPDCPLYPYRFGKDYRRTPRVLTEEQKERACRNLKKTTPATNRS
jgi:hypothetical protein